MVCDFEDDLGELSDAKNELAKADFGFVHVLLFLFGNDGCVYLGMIAVVPHNDGH